MPLVEFIYDGDCPNTRAAREQLLHAFKNAGVCATWQEWEGSDPDIPDHARRYGSPTILVDGRDVSEGGLIDGSRAYRIYQHSDGTTSGVPPLERIVSALGPSRERNPGDRKKGVMSAVSGVIGGIVVLFPKAACPA